jgi:hypothetical protein
MEKMTRASVPSRAVAEEKSKANSRFKGLVMNNSMMDTPRAADVSQKDFTFS